MTTTTASLLIAGIASLFASACATGDLFPRNVDPTGAGYDSQACVENALRRQPDAAEVLDAAPVLSAACQEGEAASCSVLGVMYELGRGFPVNAPRALALYGAACEAQNLRACGNLGDLLLEDPSSEREPARAISLLQKACDGGQARACKRLERALGDRAPQAPQLHTPAPPSGAGRAAS